MKSEVKELNRFYDMDGNEISIDEWSSLLEFSDRHIGDETKDGYRISTVLLGLDHDYFGRGDPIIFETMIFEEDTVNDVYMERYCTKEEAELGHKYAVENLSKILKEGDIR